VIRDYEVSWLPKDFAAGITLGAVMGPVGLAFGELAGVPLAGLYAGILPLIAYAAVGSWGGWCLSMGDYVRGPGATGGASAAGGCSCLLQPISRTRPVG
jgi:MFS superfamily sulfate permease-like transporter